MTNSGDFIVFNGSRLFYFLELIYFLGLLTFLLSPIGVVFFEPGIGSPLVYFFFVGPLFAIAVISERRNFRRIDEVLIGRDGIVVRSSNSKYEFAYHLIHRCTSYFFGFILYANDEKGKKRYVFTGIHQKDVAEIVRSIRGHVSLSSENETTANGG